MDIVAANTNPGSGQGLNHALSPEQRVQVLVKGIVQGVGFRPFVYQLAKKYNLRGFVTNNELGVEIEIEGSQEDIKKFYGDLQENAPPLSHISVIEQTDIDIEGSQDFVIRPSHRGLAPATLISPDMALCHDCQKELFDPANRRYRYPFINCTNCGPRYTIIESIPYDRPYTSMKHFRMCPSCEHEYNDPMDRRFHTQPNACADCGPTLSLHGRDRSMINTDDPVARSIDMLSSGKILAIKGLGGFHLACDARNQEAVKTLRQRKHREEKPLAIMVPSLKHARQFCHINPDEAALLSSRQAPIVLLKKSGDYLAPALAPGNDRLGVMLPYTPLHHLLLSGALDAVVMTSANLSDEPICIENDEAFERLGTIADAFLMHNRDIYLRCDDSVTQYTGGSMRFLRRSRGYVPKPITIKSQGAPVLGVGAELKNTICLAKGPEAFLSQHIGDLVNLEAYEHFRKTITHFERIFETRPELIVHDLHPNLLSTTWAQEQQGPALGVQHHHAHLAAVMAEHHLEDPVIGIICDGTGYGTDGNIWGGEILIGSQHEVRRYGCFEPMPLPGGDAAIKSPWRTSLGYLYTTYGKDIPELAFLTEIHPEPVLEMLQKDINCPLTSSTGRLFDAIGVICGGKPDIRYEAQTAIEFMQHCTRLNHSPFDIEIKEHHGLHLMMVSPMIRSAVQSVQEGATINTLSGRFHRTLIELLKSIAIKARDDSGLGQVVLSGGVFQNHVLFEGLILALEEAGFEVFTHHLSPTNDGGISLGQALIGRAYLDGKYKGFVG